MPGITPTDILGTGDLNPPPGVELRTKDQKDLYRASLEFERFFLQHMVKQMQVATKSLGGDDGASAIGGSTSAYADMAQDSMVQGMLDGGGLGIAATLYEQMADAMGIIDDGKPASGGSTGGIGGTGSTGSGGDEEGLDLGPAPGGVDPDTGIEAASLGGAS